MTSCFTKMAENQEYFYQESQCSAMDSHLSGVELTNTYFEFALNLL